MQVCQHSRTSRADRSQDQPRERAAVANAQSGIFFVHRPPGCKFYTGLDEGQEGGGVVYWTTWRAYCPRPRNDLSVNFQIPPMRMKLNLLQRLESIHHLFTHCVLNAGTSYSVPCLQSPQISPIVTYRGSTQLTRKMICTSYYCSVLKASRRTISPRTLFSITPSLSLWVSYATGWLFMAV